jgi:hypothetical protein
VSQPTTLPRASQVVYGQLKIYENLFCSYNDFEEFCILEYIAVYSGERQSTFPRNKYPLFFMVEEEAKAEKKSAK